MLLFLHFTLLILTHDAWYVIDIYNDNQQINNNILCIERFSHVETKVELTTLLINGVICLK